MRFGKIEYLNLIAFDVFSKRYAANSSFKSILRKKKGCPSSLNTKFMFDRIDAGFISSIAGMKSYFTKRSLNVGIISMGSVWSVLVLPCGNDLDRQSATSNALKDVLGISGTVLIGDKALKHYLLMVSNHNEDDSSKSYAIFTDMGEAWYKRERLPFVFGVFCFKRNGGFYRKLAESFIQKNFFKGNKIPHYILKGYTDKLEISKEQALEYLGNIYYRIGAKEKAGLLRFYRYLRLMHIAPPRRF